MFGGGSRSIYCVPCFSQHIAPEGGVSGRASVSQVFHQHFLHYHAPHLSIPEWKTCYNHTPEATSAQPASILRLGVKH
ncbi:hypothetical protein XELAEV_18003251mg [Xenopus laevis]|nr:hypothetical protein XELAEV_18003251mg [Xenopus laevis]